MIAKRFRVFLFDLDGVIWRGKELLPGAQEVVEELRKEGKTLCFLTNNPRRTREEVREKFRSFSISVELEEIITASWATGWYLRERGVRRGYFLGNASLREELRKMGITEDDRDPQVVVVGYDDRISFGDIARAIRFVERGVELVATNPDVAFALPEGKVPATGSVVEVIEKLTGRPATVVGKPSRYIFELLFRELRGMEREEMVLVGDSLKTDMQGAHNAGIAGILYTSRDVLLPLPGDPQYPDMVIVHLKRLLGEDLEPPHRRAVGAVIQDGEGKVLCIRRRDNGLWCLPTGKVEPQESEEEAVQREIGEELGIPVELQGLRAVYLEHPALWFTYPDGRRFHFVVFLFQGFFQGGTVRPQSEEIEDWGFFGEDDFPDPFFSLHRKWIREIGRRSDQSML